MSNAKTFYPTWFNRMTIKESHDSYIVNEYIGLDIYTTTDRKFFNATRLMKLLSAKVRADGTSSTSKSVTSLMRSKKWCGIKKAHPELFIEVKGKNTQHYKGVYMQWILFSSFIGYASAGADINFELGEPIEEDPSGYLYMCVPESCDGTDTVKFGRTWNWEQRVKGYGTETCLLWLVPVPNMYIEEEKMLQYMSAIFTNDKERGDEYFIVPADDDMSYTYFERLCEKYNVKDLSDNYP